MIDFEWAMLEHTGSTFRKSLEELAIAVHEAVTDGAEGQADDAVFALLERAGLMLDQQVRMPERGDRVFLTGAADAETLAHALVQFAHEPDAGGLLVDMATSPAQITEVRGVNSSIIVLADDQGARQLQLDPRVITSALEHALSSSA